MVALRSQAIMDCVECLIITGLSTLLTDCGVLPSLVQGLNELEIRLKAMSSCVQSNCHFRETAEKAKEKKRTLG